MITKFSFLVVDDSYIDRIVTSMLIKNILNVTEVTQAAGGKEALEQIQHYTFGNKLILLLDIKMPVMDGFDFLDEFHKLPEGLKQNITIFMLSSTIDPDDIKKAEENAYVRKILSKPLSVQELKAYLE